MGGALIPALLAALAVGLGAYGVLAGPALRARSVSTAVRRVAIGEPETAAGTGPIPAAGLLQRALLAAALFVVGLAFLPPVAAGFLGAAGFFVQPMLSSRRAVRRRQQIADTLPLALSRLASEVASGSPLPEALQAAAESLEADARGKPLAEELRRTAAEAQAQGAERALDNLQRRSDVSALAYVAAILKIHAGIGGHFEKPLQRMADDYQQLSAQVNAARAELSGARSTAVVLVLFAVVAAIFSIRDPGAGAFYRSTAGSIVLVVVGLWMALGYFFIDRMLSEVL